MSNRYIVSAECIIKHTTKYLTIVRPDNKNAGGLLSFPGGGCEKIDGGQEQDCLKSIAIREVFEEVGLKLLPEKLDYVFSSMFHDQIKNSQVIHAIFFCEIPKDITVELKTSIIEVPVYYWLTKDEIMSHEKCPSWIRQYLTMLPN